MIHVRVDGVDYYWKFNNRALVEWLRGGPDRKTGTQVKDMTLEEELDYWRCGLKEGDKLNKIEPRFETFDDFLDYDATHDGWYEEFLIGWIEDAKKRQPSEETTPTTPETSEG